MNAAEAREKAKSNIKVVIDTYVDHIDSRIKQAVDKGKMDIDDPDICYRSVGGIEWSLHGDKLKAVKLHYENLGYKWTDHPDPDPGHPCSRSYSTLSW